MEWLGALIGLVVTLAIIGVIIWWIRGVVRTFNPEIERAKKIRRANKNADRSIEK